MESLQSFVQMIQDAAKSTMALSKDFQWEDPLTVSKFKYDALSLLIACMMHYYDCRNTIYLLFPCTYICKLLSFTVDYNLETRDVLSEG